MITRTLLAGVLWSMLVLGGDDPEPLAQQRSRLANWQPFVGTWRGVGQPRRGSAKDAWKEECGWAWSFTGQHAALKLDSANGRYLRSARLVATDKPGQFTLTGTTPDGVEVSYRGQADAEGQLVLAAAKESPELPSRITIRLAAGGDRMLLLYERQAGEGRFTRLAEVGLTREGSGFGKGASYVECVVTGGVGTIPVMHDGRTYYVCCTGCRDYFQDHPEEVLAEYRARKAAEKAAAEKKDAPSK